MVGGKECINEGGMEGVWEGRSVLVIRGKEEGNV